MKSEMPSQPTHAAPAAPGGEAAFDRLLESARYLRREYGRQIETAIYLLDQERLAVTRMHDDFHDLYLAVRLDKDLNIREIAAKSERIPYPICADATAELQRLVGLHIFQRGILKSIRTLIPRAEGCTHLGELIETTLRTLFAQIESHIHGIKRQGLDLSIEERRQLNMEEAVLANTCIAFNLSGRDPEVLAVAQKKMAGR